MLQHESPAAAGCARADGQRALPEHVFHPQARQASAGYQCTGYGCGGAQTMWAKAEESPFHSDSMALRQRLISGIPAAWPIIGIRPARPRSKSMRNADGGLRWPSKYRSGSSARRACAVFHQRRGQPAVDGANSGVGQGDSIVEWARRRAVSSPLLFLRRAG